MNDLYVFTGLPTVSGVILSISPLLSRENRLWNSATFTFESISVPIAYIQPQGSWTPFPTPEMPGRAPTRSLRLN